MIDTLDPLEAVGAVVLLGVGAQWFGVKARVPSILILLAIGLVVGPVSGLVDPDLVFGDLLFPAVSLGVGILLFEGGLVLEREEALEVGFPLLRLITIGAAITWLIGAGTVWLLFDLGAPEALLIGAVLVVSGPTVVLPLLRSVNVRPASASLLKWEGILIDPVGALLAVVVLEAVLGSDDPGSIFWRVLLTLGGGALVGIAAAVLLTEALARHWIPDRLHNPVTLMCVVVAFVAAEQIRGEAGLTATTMMGIYMANQRRAPARHLAEFQEELSVLVLGALFVVLGARVDLDAVWEFLPRALTVLAVLVLVARPIAVVASTLGTSLPRRDRMFVAALAPRGIVAAAVASLFALELEEHGTPIEEFVPVVFTVIIGSVIVYSLSSGFAARRLKVARAARTGVALVGGAPWVLEIADRLVDLEVPVLVITSDPEEMSAAFDKSLLVFGGRIDSTDLVEAAEAIGVSTVIGLAARHEVNDLALRRLAEVVGRVNLFRLPVSDGDEVAESGSKTDLVGRRPFGDELTRDQIEELIGRGARVLKLTSLPANRQSWMSLLIVDAEGLVRVAEPGEALMSGDYAIGLVGHRLDRLTSGTS